MSNQPFWMWYPGDFEIYHSMKLNCRREERSFHLPAFWRLDDCWHNVRFRKHARITKAESISVFGNGVGHVLIGGVRYPYGMEIQMAPGDYTVEVVAAKTDGLPCVYVTGNMFASGADWEADHLVSNWLPAGYSEMYPSSDDNPEIFQFQYKRIYPISSENKDGGMLYDFGKETFAELNFEKLTKGSAFFVYYGESMSEALDTELCYIYDQVPSDVLNYSMPPRAFRYIYIPDFTRVSQLSALYEYLPLEYKGSFRCSDEKLNQIWDTAAYTFHLNSREFFLDGIKRDRWVWSGDAYQSYLINYYLFFDKDIIKRTTIALRGKDPVEQHINTILDYSFYWIIGVGDYYKFTGDLEFVRFIWPRLQTLLDFCLARRNSEGFVSGLENDWVFIDWHQPLDKTGPVCAEQMLFARALEVAANCADLLQIDKQNYRKTAADLYKNIDCFYWNEDKGAYVDSYESGRNNVTRHANIFAILFEQATEERRNRIVKNVLLNNEIPQITTPYFKFYELEALCTTNQQEKVLKQMQDYWGGMLDLGATTIWEEFDPTMEGDEHYDMYGSKYHKSLCHAWGASPIYLLGRYFLGVSPTSDAYETFDCIPNLGGLDWMEGIIPIGDGKIEIILRDGLLCITANREGGTLVWKGNRIPIPAGERMEIVVERVN